MGIPDMVPGVNKQAPTRLIVFTIFLFFVLKVDLWSYLEGVHGIRPLAMLAVLALPLFALDLARALANPKTICWPASMRGFVVVVSAFILVEAMGLAKWDHMPGDLRLWFHWILTLLTVFFAMLLASRAIGSVSEGERFAALLLMVHSFTLFFDYFVPGSLSEYSIGGRAAGFTGNPNSAAFISSLLLVIALPWQKPELTASRVVLCALTIGSTILTGSRGGLLALLVPLFAFGLRYVIAATSVSVASARVISISILAFLAVLILLVFAFSTGSRFAELAESDSLATDYAASQRVIGAVDSLRIIMEKPWLGAGTAYSYTLEVGPHNMLLRVWLDNGFWGAILYFAIHLAMLALAVRKGSWMIGVSALTLLSVGFTSHNVPEDRSILFLVGLVLYISVFLMPINGASGDDAGAVRG